MNDRALLDTSVLIAPPAGGLASLTEAVAVSIVSVAELQYGVALADDPVEELARRRRLQAVLEGCDVLGLDVATTELYGALAGLVVRMGRHPRPRRFDLLIAATASRHGIPVLTRNADDLRGLERLVTVTAVV